MAGTKSRTGRTFTRHVAPFAPLALALAIGHLPGNRPSPSPELTQMDIPDNITAVACEDNIADFQECHDNYPTGCSKAAKYDAYLNYLKNLTPSQPAGGVNFLDLAAFDNLNSRTPDGLGQSNNHADFKQQLAGLGEGSQSGIIGYLYYFEATGAESSNCELTGPDKDGGNVDFHIGIGFDKALATQVNVNNPSKPPKALEKNSVIVEMTPHYRARFQDGIWTLANLKPALGHKVKVVGQLLVDSEHNKPADNCAIKGTPAQQNHCWRYSIWELHPVTMFAYCADDSCTENSGNWISLGALSSGVSSHTSGGSSETPSGTEPNHRSYNSGQSVEVARFILTVLAAVDCASPYRSLVCEQGTKNALRFVLDTSSGRS